MKGILCVLTATALLCLGLYGQSNSGTIVGVVADPAGAVIPDAMVTVTNTGTGLNRVITTNANGQYRADAFPTGNLTITVEKAGFQKLTRSGIALTAADILTVNLELTVGNVQQTVNVTGEAPQLESQTATISTLVNNQQMVEIPLNGRSFTQLLQLSSGASPLSPGTTVTSVTGYSARANNSISINGNTAQNNSFLVDGLYDVGLWTEAVILPPVLDAIQEERLMANVYSAQYGGSAGAVTLVQTKSGSNAFHGDVYDFFRNGDLDANYFFNNKNGIAKPIQQRNEFGATLGGPIRKDKTFFFIDYQGVRWNLPINQTNSIPTIAQRQMVETGNFSALSTQLYDPVTKLPYSGNIIPLNKLNPAAVAMMTLLPTPTSSGATNNFVYNPVGTQDVNQADVRIDQNVGTSDRFFFKWSYDPYNAQGNCTLPPDPTAAKTYGVNPNCLNSNFYSNESRDYTLTANYTKILTPTLIDEIRVGAIRNYLNNYNPDYGLPIAANLGIPGLSGLQTLNNGIPGISISGFATVPTLGTSGSSPEFLHTVSFQYEDVATWNKGNHSFKFGGVYFRDRFDGHTSVYPRGYYDFNGQFTSVTGAPSAATALADFAEGVPDSIQRSEQFGTFGMRRWRMGLFAEDSWRATNRLTVTYGLRYELQAPYYEVYDRWTNLTPGGQVLFPQNNPCGRSTICLDKTPFAPRVGVAYMLTKDQKTVFRAGSGMSYFWGTNGGRSMISNAPMNIIQQFTSAQGSAPTLSLTQALPTPTVPNFSDPSQLTQIYFAFDPHMKLAQNIQWSASLQRQLMSDLMLDVAYVGTRTNDMMNIVDANMAVPGPGAFAPRRPLYSVNPAIPDIAYRTNAFAAKYHSLQVNLDKRYAKGLTGHIAYTYSHNMSNTVGPNAAQYPPMNSYCTACDWGPVNEDRRQMLVINHVYELPFGTGRQFLNHGLASHIAGDWNVSGLWTLYSGMHFNPINGVSNISNSQYPGSTNFERPNVVAACNPMNVPGGQTITEWFNPACFTLPASYTFGDAGAYTIVGPALYTTDLAIDRNFAIREGMRLTFRWEMFNTFNHANFSFGAAGQGQANVVAAGSASAGVLTSTFDPRRMQVALKLVF